MWTLYKLQLTFLTKLCGSVPADPDIIAAWVKARIPKVKPPSGKSIEEITEEVVATLAATEPAQEHQLLVFQRDHGTLVMRAATLRAHIKDCARVLSNQYIGRIRGERAFSTRVVNGVYLDERHYWLPILRPQGTPISKADGETDKPIHVRGPRGEPYSALKRYEWVFPARIDATLKILGQSVAESDLHHIFTYGGVHGYAGERGDGEGRYVFTLTRIKEQRDGKAQQAVSTQKRRGSHARP